MSDILTVTKLNSYIKSLIEQDHNLYDIVVEGEISGFRLYPSGHAYFTVKDSQSSIKCVYFRGYHKGNIPKIENGDNVLIYGSIGVYTARGEYQFYVRNLEKSGFGLLARKFEELKAKLKKEGLFEPEHKKKLPDIVNKIGVVSGMQAAGFKDMIKILKGELFDVIIKNSRVQGKEAAGEIVAGIKALNEDGRVDVIIIGRGGGSIEDLWPFNEEIVARAVFESKIPVISAVGHEIDILISDMVADIRAETPTAAAEMLVRQKRELRKRLSDLKRHLIRMLENNLLIRKKELQHFSIRRLSKLLMSVVSEKRYQLINHRRILLSSPKSMLENYRMRLTNASVGLMKTEKTFNELNMKLDDLRQSLQRYMLENLKEKKDTVDRLKMKLNLLSPMNIISKGYSLTTDEKGKLIKDVGQVKKGQKIKTSLANGSIFSEVKNTVKSEK